MDCMPNRTNSFGSFNNLGRLTLPRTQIEIEQILATLRSLLEEVTLLRQQVIDLQAKLDIITHDYDLKLGKLDIEVSQLESRRKQLTALLAGRQQLPRSVSSQDSLAEVTKVSVRDSRPLIPLPESPRTQQKRVIADHIFLFVASDQESIVMREINALLTDERRNMGDMLEILKWGAIWTSRASWETLEKQYDRLHGWNLALQQRLADWHHEICQLKADWRYTFWEKKVSLSPEGWEGFLNDLARQQEKTIENLAHKVKVLEQECQKKRKESGENIV